MKSDQDLYKQLRDLPKERLWAEEVTRFDAAGPRERLERVAVIRAVGMMFGRFGTDGEKERVRCWLIALLADPQEKIRRYAATALPKVGAGEQGEARILEVLGKGAGEREQRHLGRALEKVGGSATLALAGSGVLPRVTEQKVRAGVARRSQPSAINLQASLPTEGSLQVRLRCRRGLEALVHGEAVEKLLPQQGIRLGAVHPGMVSLEATDGCSLADLYRLRCFATVGFPLGTIREDSPDWPEALADCIASPLSRALISATTSGIPRYRIDFPERGHQRGAIRRVIDRVFEQAPGILNDSREAPWSVDVIPAGRGRRESFVELRPRLHPDPRLAYRQDDIPAASHPPLAACMARLAGPCPGEVVWDPFCGSGLELVERTLLGGVAAIHGTDLDQKAINVAKANLLSAGFSDLDSQFLTCDFREALNSGHPAGIAPGTITLVITNPPLGRRVRVKDMQGLFADLYRIADRALRPGGRLVLVNPLRSGPTGTSLRLESRQPVDLGGFDCRLELYIKEGFEEGLK